MHITGEPLQLLDIFPDMLDRSMIFFGHLRNTLDMGTKGVAEKCHFCMHRLDAGLLPACVITCQGITLDYGNFSALQKKYPQGKEMGDDFGPKVLYGNMGDEPKRPTAGYPDPVPCHDDD